jgi:hypothetical protein
MVLTHKSKKSMKPKSKILKLKSRELCAYEDETLNYYFIIAAYIN